MSKVTVFIADGTEEVECLTIVDLLRRAGIDVRLVSIMESQTVLSSHKVTIVADGQFDTKIILILICCSYPAECRA